jgi:hypothetical protein
MLSGTPTFQRRQRDGQLPLPVRFRDQTFGLQIIDCVDQEQRVAIGALVQKRGEGAGKLMLRKAHWQIFAHHVLTQVFQWKLFTQPVRLQILLDASEWVFAQCHVDRTISRDEQQLSRLAPPCKVGDQIERRVVAPV